MAQCGFKTDIEYYDEKTGGYIRYECNEPKENVLNSGLCIFHDENYLKDLQNKEANEQNIKKKLIEKIEKYEPLIFIGYHLPDFSFEQYFDKSVNFSGTIFAGLADFSWAQFTAEVNFPGAKFTAGADFSGAQFTAGGNFFGAQFTAGADFSQARFTEAEFFWAQFTAGADFPGAEFTAGADFSQARFTAGADFSQARFTEKAGFSGAQFTNGANFYNTEFTEKADFSGAQFTNGANFIRAKINNANFYKAQFSGKADFSEVGFTETDYPYLNFRNVQFEDQEHIIFLKNNLSEVSFVNTDITRIRFGEDVLWGDESKIREEREMENQLKTSNTARGIQLGDVLAVYRNLRENYEFRMRYDEAGEFFIRELEMKRLYKQDIRNGQSRIRRNNPIVRNLSLTGLYYHLSKYGESFSRPTIFGIGIILISTLLWLIQENPSGYFSLSESIGFTQVFNVTQWQEAIERSLSDFIPFLPVPSGIEFGLADFIFKIVGGAVTFGLIIIALRRKFERKFRH